MPPEPRYDPRTRTGPTPDVATTTDGDADRHRPQSAPGTPGAEA